jgi:UDP-4-amino-4,6-dideoxy-N-acetyl-beta-L-altrosamine N-acetyltransferase
MLSSLGVLREIRASELELIRSWRNSPSVRLNMYTRHEISKDEHQRWWNETSARLDRKYLMYEFSGLPSGVVGFSDIDFKNKNSFWAFYSDPQSVRGTGSKMEFLALDYAFSELGLYKLNCEVLAFNESVIKLHKKFGFQIEGIFRRHHNIDEKFVDIYRAAIFSDDWVIRRREMFEKLCFVNRKK